MVKRTTVALAREETTSPSTAVHCVTGQTEAIEWILRPTIGGFTKRMNITFSPDEPPCNSKQQRDDSRKFIHSYFTWLFENVSKKPEVKFLSNEARSLYDAVMNARKDVDNSMHDSAMNGFLKVKLAFMDTDILRWCNVAHGMIHHACSHNIMGEPPTRVMGLFPLMYAIHAWLRQVQLHAAYYKWWTDITQRVAEKRLPDLMEAEGSIVEANPTLTLSLPDYVAYEVLSCAQPGREHHWASHVRDVAH